MFYIVKHALILVSGALRTGLLSAVVMGLIMLGAEHLPLTVLVDAQGRVLSKVVGAREWDDPASMELIRQTFRLRTNTSAAWRK